ncbi:hypothetical protein JTB14_035098 [Gonioctena quinquepunctata]|nr:hypothetical protein JTB14_035098 [Gonioctena quinquepunctata]
MYIINSDQINADKIIVKYFEAGHTFMSADSFHHRVELAMKRMKNKIYDFDDFCEAVSSAGKNVNTKKMTVDDFYEWQDYTTQYKLSRLSPRPYISEIVEVEVSRGSFDISYKTGFDNEPITASIIGAKFLKLDKLPPPTKKTVPAGISQTKKKYRDRHKSGNALEISTYVQQRSRNFDICPATLISLATLSKKIDPEHVRASDSCVSVLVE